MRVGLPSLLVLIVALSLVAADDNFITVEEGNLQSTYLNNQFAQQLRIIVKTSQGQPAKQVQVTLLSPPTGASALFNSATGSFTHLASTDSDGRVSVNVFANSIVGSYSITVRAPGATPAQITLYNNANPATVTVVSGDGQSAVVNTLFVNKLVGRLTDASGLPVVFVNVILDVQANANNGATGAFPGDLTSLPIKTDNSGNFETSIQAGKKIGSYKVVSRVNDNPSAISATWNLVNTYDAGYSIASRSGQNQVTTVNTNFKNPLVAVVTDQFGNPVPGITVTFQIPRDAAAFGSFLFVPDAKTATAVTNVDGVATSPTIAANAVSGGYTASASATLGGSVKTAPFELYNNPNYETLTYTVVSPKVQITTIANQMFTEDLVLQVTDPGLNPVPNVTISFQAPTDPLGATCYWGEDTSYVTRTNGTGHAVAPAPRASKIKGNFGVLYNPDSPSRDPFSLLVNPDVPATITAKTGSDPTVVNREFKNPLLAIVRDQFGNGVPNTPVWFYREDDEDSCYAPENPQTQLTDVPSLLFNNVRCSKNIVGDSVGSVLSLSPLRINQVAGTYKIVAVVALENYDVKTTFTLTNLPEKAVSLEIVGAATKQAQVGEAFDNLQVAAYDVYHNLVPGVTVNFWAPQPPVSATIQSSAVTGTGLGASGDLGVAQTTAVALERPGTFQVTANSTGINNEVTFTLTSVVNDPHLLHFESGASAQAIVDQLFADTFKVLVTDLFGNPVEGVTVQFEVPETDESASGSFTDDSTRVTDEDGFVTLVGDQDFKANKVAGEYQLKVTVPGFNVDPIFSNLVNLPSDPDHFDVLFPNPSNLRNEAVVTGLHFPSILLHLLDQFNNVVPNKPVQFKLQPGVSLGAGIPSGLFVDSNALIYTPQTNTSGHVSARQIRANQFAGTFTVEVSVPDFADNPDLSLNFLFYNKPATPHRIESNYDESAAQATVDEQFDSLELTVYDEYDNTVLDDVTVELWIGESESDSASAYFLDGTDQLTFWSLTTDKNGKTEAPALYANQFSGTYTLTIDAKVGEVIYGSPLYIDLTNVPGPVTLIDVLSGANQHIKVTENYQPIVVQLFDKFNNTVNYRDLTFEVDAQDDPSAGFGGDNTYTDSSNGQGIVTSGILTANQFAGEFHIRVSIDGTETSIPQLNIPNDPAYFVFDDADVREAVVDNNFADPIGVTVYDAYDNLVYDTPVAFTSPVSGASLFFEESVTNYTLVTNSDGYVNTGDLLANTISGAFKVLVACPGFFAPESVSFTNKPDAAYRFAFLTPDYRVLAKIETQSDKINVLVLDQFDNPVQGTSVTFTVVPNPSNSAGGSFQSSGTTSTGVSDANGVVTPANAFIANSVASSYTIVASADGLDDIDIPVQNVNNVPDIISQSTPDQVVQAGTIVDKPLFVVVLDQGSNAATGYGVTFTTPLTGPSCFFANNKNSALVIIDETGRAQAPDCTANGVLGQFSVTATAIGDLSVDMHVTVVVGDATNIAVSGDKQSVQVTQSFTSIEITVTDSFGNVVPGVQVTFSVPSSGASATIDGQSSLVLATGPNGKVSTSGHTLTANAVAGTWILDVTVQGIVAPKQVTLTNTPAAANKLTLVSGGDQSTTVATSFGSSIVIRASDQYNNAVPGSSVTLTAPSAAASLFFSNNQNTITGTTGADGTYTVSAPTASNGAGTYSIAVTGAKDLAFSMTNTAGAVAQFTRQGSSSRTAKVNTAYTETFSVLAADKYGNPRSGISVMFSAPSSSATGSFAGSVSSYTTTTNAAGVATSSTFTANTVAGQFSVSVNTTSVSTTLTFACENEAGAAAHIEVSSGNGQSVKPASSLSPLAVIVSDHYSNPVAGASVTFTAPTTGSRLTFSGTNTASSTTDSDGVVSTVAPVAGTVAGSFKVTATSGALSTQFSLTIVPGSPAALAIISGSSQSTVVNTPFSAAIVVNVTDQYNNAVPNVAVVFSAPASGPSATFVNGTVLSDAQGVATSSSFTATTTAGSFAVSVSAPGASLVNVPLLNRPAAPSQVIVSSKPTSSAVVGTEFAELAVLVKDQYDNTVSGVAVTFTAPASGASGVFNQSQSRQATSVTGSNGVATSPFFIANTVSGSYSVNATVSGVASVASFTLTNEPDVAFAVSVSSGDAQSTSPSTQFTQPLYVLVKDKYNNPVAGVSVAFTILGNSSSVFANGLTTSTALSSVSGRAASPLITAGTKTGSFNVVANVTSIGSVTFSLSITQPPVAAPIQAPGSEEPIAAPVSGSAPTAGTSPIPQDAGTVSSSNTVVVNSVAVLLATVFYICF